MIGEVMEKEGGNTKTLFYRFRSIDKLLGKHKELERQTIYFASPSELNDPMEGYRDLHWSGDEIVWRNLFKHYLFCLERVTSEYVIGGEEHALLLNNIPVFVSGKDFQTDEYSQLFNDIKTAFFKLDSIGDLIKSIAARTIPIRRSELKFYLKTIHLIALKVIVDSYIEYGLSPESDRIECAVSAPLDSMMHNDFFGNIEKSLLDANIRRTDASKLFDIMSNTDNQLRLLTKYNNKTVTPNKDMLLIDFTDAYIKRLEALVYPDWYTACFMSECKSPSVWGHYGDNHAGVCLIFKSVESKNGSSITLSGITGDGGARRGGHSYSYGKISHKFHKVDYIEGAGEVDFFRYLGVLPIPTINSMWHYSENGEVSVCAEDMAKSEDKWRSKYWQIFYRDIIKKSDDWRHENEYRLIYQSSITDLSVKKNRTLNYDFLSLDGIIFGINTNDEDRLKILEIIDKKCTKEQRADFKFYQAYYSHENKYVEHIELNLIRPPLTFR